jgi:hypothetical protein
MDRQGRTGDTLLVKSREMTGRTQTLPRWLRGEEVKTTENEISEVRKNGKIERSVKTVRECSDDLKKGFDELTK